MKKTNMKKGITLIEIILAIVLIAIILGLTIPKLMTNSKNAELKQTITNDIRNIVEAAITWKKTTRAASGNYRNITSAVLATRLPSNMVVVAADNIIYSSGLRTGNGVHTGVEYFITWQFDAATFAQESGRFSIGASFKPGVDDLQWNDRTRDYAIEIFNDTVDNLSDGQNNAHAVAVAAPAAFACDDAEVICKGNINIQ